MTDIFDANNLPALFLERMKKELGSFSITVPSISMTSVLDIHFLLFVSYYRKNLRISIRNKYCVLIVR